jgi:hypothetical protein
VTGLDCCGCILAAVGASNVELRYNECGAAVGIVQIDVLVQGRQHTPDSAT